VQKLICPLATRSTSRRRRLGMTQFYFYRLTCFAAIEYQFLFSLLIRHRFLRATAYTYAIARFMPCSAIPSVRLSLRLSHACIVSKRLNISSKFFYYLICPMILVFRHQELLRKSGGFTPNGGAEYKGVAIFDEYAATSRKW